MDVGACGALWAVGGGYVLGARACGVKGCVVWVVGVGVDVGVSLEKSALYGKDPGVVGDVGCCNEALRAFRGAGLCVLGWLDLERVWAGFPFGGGLEKEAEFVWAWR